MPVNLKHLQLLPVSYCQREWSLGKELGNGVTDLNIISPYVRVESQVWVRSSKRKRKKMRRAEHGNLGILPIFKEWAEEEPLVETEKEISEVL